MEYTRGGFESAMKSFNAADLNVDLSKKSIMVTGANSGIGKTTALEVAKRNATVHMICRSKERGEAAQKEIIDQSKNQVVLFFFKLQCLVHISFNFFLRMFSCILLIWLSLDKCLAFPSNF